jgi:predicted TIM-barrel fold metal-dependent hydrolase
VAIDFHAHLGREDPDAPPFLAHLFDVEGYLERQEEAGLELTLLSYVPESADLERARSENGFLAELVARHDGRFRAFAGVDPFAGGEWLELGRQALDDGFAGLCFPTSRDGTYLDADQAQDAFAMANEKGALVFLHPAESPVAVERLGDKVMEGWIGRPYDTGICLSRMLLADTLSRYPDVRMVVAHCGGMLPMLLGRLGEAYGTFERRAAFGGGAPGGGGPPGGGGGPPGGGGGPPKGPPQPLAPDAGGVRASVEGGPLTERLGQLYFDTAGHHHAALRAAFETVGVDQIVVGTDYPPAGDSPKEALELIDGLGLDSGDRDKVLTGNARRLLDL